MSVAQLKEATGLQKQPTKALTFRDMLEQHKSQIARALPKHLNPDRMVRIALTEFSKNPSLAECDPKTVFAAIIMASQLGLEPGIMGQAYLIPYGKTCTFVPGWQGYVDLVSRSGRASVWTGAVRQGDEFSYEVGARPALHHVPSPDSDDDSDFTYVYAVGWVKDAQWPVIEVWSHAKVTKHRDRYNKVGKRHYSFLNAHNFELYGRKIALLQVLKYLPKSVELQTAASLDNAAEAGAQTISVDEAVAGTFIPAGYQNESPVIEGQVELTPEVKKAEEMFQLIGTPPMKQAELLKEYQGRLGELIVLLEKELER